MAKIVLNRPPARTSRDYRLFQEHREYPHVLDLSCYGVGQPEPDRTNPVRINTWCVERGVRVPRRKTIYGAVTREWSIPILLPEGVGLQWNELEEIAGKPCDRDFFLIPTCTDDEHFFRLPEAVLDEVELDALWVEARDGDGAPLTSLSNLHTPRIIRYDALEAVEVQTEAAALHAITWRNNQCEQCSLELINNGIYGGLQLLDGTVDGFANGTALTVNPALAATETVQDIYTEGNLVIAVTSDSAGDGRILVSTDGENFIDTAPASAPDLFAVTRAGSYYVVVGATGIIYRSLDATTWTVVPNTVAATADLNDIAHDPSTGITYIAGTDSGAGVALTMRGAVLQDISADLPGSPDALTTVTILEPDHVAFGGLVGSSGYVAENRRASVVSTYTIHSIGSAAVGAILGDTWRTIVAAGKALYVRSVYNDMTFNVLPYAANTTVTGNYTAGVGFTNEIGESIFALTTDVGEIVVIAPRWDRQAG